MLEKERRMDVIVNKERVRQWKVENQQEKERVKKEKKKKKVKKKC